MPGLILIAALVCICIVLPIVAFVRTNKIRNLEFRLAGVEAALLRLMREQAAAAAPHPESAPPPVIMPAIEAAPPAAETPMSPAPADTAAPHVEAVIGQNADRIFSYDREGLPPDHLEVVIGQKWLAWVAIVLIFSAASFFLKYAFENRWIGELGRVSLGIAAGLGFAWAGLDRHRRGWRYLSQVLTGGGITILYLSVYSAFAYYHLVDQRSAFVFLVILVAEAHLLALAYDARPIAVMALLGGFLVPVLLSTGRDEYRVLFAYIGVLDLGMLGVVIARRWRWIGTLAYAGTQCLFWAWYGEHYHLEKRMAVLLFQAAIFVLFVLADLAPHLRRAASGWEEWIRVALNPFVFYSTCYFLLNDDRHEWMAALALTLAIVYAALARAELALYPSDLRVRLATVGTALTFVTLAIPVQLESNWITIAWAVEALAMLWASFETPAPPLRVFSATVFFLALIRFLFVDTPWGYRAPFTPVLNRYFLGMLALAGCLGAAAYLYRGLDGARDTGARMFLMVAMAAVGVLCLGSSVEAYTYFAAQAQTLARPPAAGFNTVGETADQLRWAGQLSLSVLWSLFAGSMTAAGFRLQIRAWRVAGLFLFGVTLAKVLLFDISELRQFYRILALLALGVVLLVVAWKYQRGLRRDS